MRVSGRCWQGRWRVALSSLIEAARGLAAHDGPVTAPILVWTGSTQFSISAPRRGAQVAQSVEQRTENPCVGGSIPPLGTSFINELQADRRSGFPNRVAEFSSSVHFLVCR